MILTPDNEYTAVLDACVPYPMPLCDTLLRLAEDPSFYRPLWSEQILQEVGNILLEKSYSQAQKERRLNVMRQCFPEALVEVPEELIAAVGTIPDLNDHHVLAAAIASKANAIITQNTKHFLPECLEKYGVLCQNADDFLVHQYYLGPEQFAEKLDEQAAAVKQERNMLLQNLAKAAPRFCKLISTGELPP